MSTAYDYSSGPIAPAALIAAGVRTVMRYVSTPGNSKNISRSEYAELVAAGITVGLVYETTADWMLGGEAAGVAAAHAARAQATAVGYPTTRPIWYAADFEAAAGQLSTVVDALHGCAAAEGSSSLVRVYGDFDVCNAALAAGFGAPWQTDAWSSGRWCTAAVLQQTGQQTTCGGVQVDINNITGALFPAPVSAAPAASEEDDVLTTTSVNGRAGLQWPGGPGGKGIVQVGYDPGAGDMKFRVVLVMPTGPWVAPIWEPAHGSGDYAIPANFKADCRGVIVTAEPGSPATTFDICAA